jgi:myo-inositol-hexaphosphate 3-phosphohydrolase
MNRNNILNKVKFIAKNLSDIVLYISFIFVLLCGLLKSQTLPDCQLSQFGVISVDPDFEVNGQGQNIDTIEFWKAPDSTESLMFVSAKDNQLVEVWKYPFEGNEQQPLTHSTFSNSQVNGLAVDQENDLLYVAIGEPSSTVSVFSLPDLTFQFNFNQAGMDYHSEPNLTILKLSNGDKNIYVSADFTVDIHNALTGSFINQFTPTQGLETMAADNFYQRLYIPDENNRTGVYVYNPNGTPYTNNGSNIFGDNEIFDSDEEGIIIYICPNNNPVDSGKGFIVVTDQKSTQTDFEFFDRVTWKHLGKLNITGVSNTDGIASYPYPLPGFPMGIFAALNNDTQVAIVGWEKIFSEILSHTDVEGENYIPEEFKLYQNYANPFNPVTKIKYQISKPGLVTLKIYDILGKEVTTLVQEEKSAGTYEVEFEGTNLPSGIYFYKLTSGDNSETKKMTLLR